MSAKRGLGKGLDALLPTGEDNSAGGGVLLIPIDEIEPNPRQPRSHFDQENLNGLSDSIREHGILQPLIVSPSEEGFGYKLIAGERRLQASRMAGLERVPVIVRAVNDQQRLELALIENLQRDDLNALDAAEGYRQLADDFSLSHDAIAARVGKSRTAITNTLRLLKLTAPVRQALEDGEISEGHARALLTLKTTQSQVAALHTILKRQLNVRQTEELVREPARQEKKEADKTSRSADEIALEDQLRQKLGTRVNLKRGQHGGTITIRFFSDEELNALVDQILNPDSM